MEADVPLSPELRAFMEQLIPGLPPRMRRFATPEKMALLADWHARVAAEHLITARMAEQDAVKAHTAPAPEQPETQERTNQSVLL